MNIFKRSLNGQIVDCTCEIKVCDSVFVDVLQNGKFNKFTFDKIIEPQDEEDFECWVFSGTGTYCYYPELDRDEQKIYGPFKLVD